eukprot:TRINITY_DN10566_c0_g1_i7.p2 TRINITY_DN10566_c0_g1~~TRINITY_DN10566_c0_g1_i7.p2  ORF type:complete len:104 (+),score=36.88 TRINITY_DN10566_c0_g1_i7:45-314(+)
MLRSLVGSEMCIRDRYQRRVRGPSKQERCMLSPARAPRRFLAHTDCHQALPPAVQSRGSTSSGKVVLGDPRRFISVSYTHLTLPTKRIV